MAKKAAPTDLSSSEFNDETTSSEDQERISTKRRTKKTSIKTYVTDVLTKQESDHGQTTDLTQTQMKIDRSPNTFRNYENVSAFRQFPSNAENTRRADAQRRQGRQSSSDDDSKHSTPTGRVRKE